MSQSKAFLMPGVGPPIPLPADTEIVPRLGSSRRTVSLAVPMDLTTVNNPTDSIKGLALIGWAIIFLFFGGVGYWATTAPLRGAVVAQAVVKVEGNRKSVQHLDGGIVKEIMIKEGDRVKIGDVLLVLNDSQVRTEYEILFQQHLVLRATEERLKAELIRSATLTMPNDLVPRARDPIVKEIWSGQLHQFDSRLASLEGQRNIIKAKIAQLQSQIAGNEGMLKAYLAQLESVRRELRDLKPLMDDGTIPRTRYLQLERAAAGLQGQIADTHAVIAKSQQAIAEQNQQAAQLDNERMTDVTRDLRDTQSKLLEVISKLVNAKAVLDRVEIRTPYAGRIVGLSVFSVGGVIARGEKILDVVPDDDSMVIEAQVAVDEIADIHPDMRAEVHLTSYKQRITPTVGGTITQVSADRLTDAKSNVPYYIATVRVDIDALAKLPHVQLYPGAPATVVIPTEERTAFDYLVGPLVQSFNRAFRQR